MDSGSRHSLNYNQIEKPELAGIHPLTWIAIETLTGLENNPVRVIILRN